MSSDRVYARAPHRGAPVQFSRAALEDFVTGFRQRRLERQSYAAAQNKLKERKARNEARKEKRDALKVQFDTIAKRTTKRQRAAAEEMDAEHRALFAHGQAEDDDDAAFQTACPADSADAPHSWQYADSVATVTVTARRPEGFESEDEVDEPAVKYEHSNNSHHDGEDDDDDDAEQDEVRNDAPTSTHRGHANRSSSQGRGHGRGSRGRSRGGARRGGHSHSSRERGHSRGAKRQRR